MNDSTPTGHPRWFRFDAEGPHRKSGGLGADSYSYEFYCVKDGQRWPCDAERDRQADSTG